jgi:hypothetical protein
VEVTVTDVLKLTVGDESNEDQLAGSVISILPPEGISSPGVKIAVDVEVFDGRRSAAVQDPMDADLTTIKIA